MKVSIPGTDALSSETWHGVEIPAPQQESLQVSFSLDSQPLHVGAEPVLIMSMLFQPVLMWLLL